MLDSAQTFERRHVLYCDILGFSEYVQGEFFEESRCFRLFHHLDEVIRQSNESIDRSAPDPTTGVVPDYVVTPQATYCSDSIIISTPPTTIDAIWLCEAAARIQNSICHLGFLLRGGIATGLVYHSQNTIFGPAITKAAAMEKEVSWPVIAIASETHQIFHEAATAEDQEIVFIRSKQLISSANAEKPFVDPFWILKIQCMQPTLNPHTNIQIESWRGLLEHGLHSKIPKVRKKYEWAARHFNLSLCGHSSRVRPILIERFDQNFETNPEPLV